MGVLTELLDRRFGFKRPHGRLFYRNIPEGVNYFFCLGGVAFILFLLLFATGMLLALHYIPSEESAYRSIVVIQREIRLGGFIRSLHKWSAHLFIVAILLHTVRVFVYKAYRHPRELNWIVGSMTLVVAMASGFTGYLLPWDGKAYWATKVGTAMAGTIPVAGQALMLLLRGGEDVSETTLIRFYALHVVYLPLFMCLLLWTHFHLVKRRGVKAGL
jgi:quinol-cytochrome oxidoreductase complex cytochrome b subunit